MGFFRFGRSRRRDYDVSSSCSSWTPPAPVLEIRVPTNSQGWIEETLDGQQEFPSEDPILRARELHDEKSVDPIRMIDDDTLVQKIIAGLQDQDEQLVENVKARWKAKRQDDPSLAALTRDSSTFKSMGSGKDPSIFQEAEEAVIDLVMELGERFSDFSCRMEKIGAKMGVLGTPERSRELGKDLEQYPDLGGAPEGLLYLFEILELGDLQNEMGLAVSTAMDNIENLEDFQCAESVTAKEAGAKRRRGWTMNRADVVDELG